MNLSLFSGLAGAKRAFRRFVVLARFLLRRLGTDARAVRRQENTGPHLPSVCYYLD